MVGFRPGPWEAHRRWLAEILYLCISRSTRSVFQAVARTVEALGGGGLPTGLLGGAPSLAVLSPPIRLPRRRPRRKGFRSATDPLTTLPSTLPYVELCGSCCGELAVRAAVIVTVVVFNGT